jgi:molybdate transport system substrate-binding protein
VTWRRVVASALVALAIGACGTTASGTTPQPTLTVFAAASLRTAMDAVAAAYGAATGVGLVVATDSSAALATQIEQGAPVDVFLSADEANPQRLVDGGLAVGPAVTFARNGLAIIVPADDRSVIDPITSPADLARPGVRVIAAGDDVPITAYAAALIANLATLDGYPTTFADDYAANIVSREDNVAAVVAKIELGEGDAAIVYATDARGATDVRTVELPAAADVSARYGAVVIGSSADVGGAQAFLDWLVGPDGQAVLAGFGFLTATP